MIRILWSFRVRHDRIADFIRAYGPHGDWAQLFAKSPAYHGTQLLRDGPATQRYVTIDTWDSQRAFDEFKRQAHDPYMELDQRFEQFTEIEEHIGTFDVVE